MDENNPINSVAGRSLAGALAGGVFGAAAQVIYVWGGLPPHGAKLPWQGALIGAVLVGAVSNSVGARRLPNSIRRKAIGLLAGVVVGVLGGKFVFAPIMSVMKTQGGYAFCGRLLALYERTGIAGGAFLGGAIGLAIGFAIDWYDLHYRNAERSSIGPDENHQTNLERFQEWQRRKNGR